MNYSEERFVVLARTHNQCGTVGVGDFDFRACGEGIAVFSAGEPPSVIDTHAPTPVLKTFVQG
jgi:hypothetical protein